MTTSIFAQVPPLETGVSQDLAKWRSANYSDIKYKLNITLEKGAPLMKGDIEISVKLTDEGAKNDLVLDWRTTQFGGDKDKPFADVVAVNDSAIKKMPDIGKFVYFIDKEHIVVTQRLLKTGENIIKINFASPIKTSGSAITRYVDKEDNAEYIYSLFVPSDASTAFPVFDQPDLKARFQLKLIVDSTWETISNYPVDTVLRRRKDSSEIKEKGSDIKIVSFKETKPISSYVFAFAAGNFVEFGGRNEEDILTEIKNEQRARGELDGKGRFTINNDEVRLRTPHIYVRKSQAEKFKQHSAEVFRLNREGVKFLAEFFDYKFPFPKYDLVLIPEFPFGGMEHAGATFLRETSVIFPTEPTKNDYVSRANVIFHEAAHQWFGDTVTMKWFDDLWLKEGFAEFMAYKTLENCLPEYNAWKIFYERNKQGAYLTDSTKGTTPIYQEIKNLSAAKSAYGNIVYRKAPSFLKQAEFYLGEKEFQTAVRAFLKKHEFANAEWTDLVREFETVNERKLGTWGKAWIRQRGLPKVEANILDKVEITPKGSRAAAFIYSGVELKQTDALNENGYWTMRVKSISKFKNGRIEEHTVDFEKQFPSLADYIHKGAEIPEFVFPNYQDYGYGIFLLDEKSREYVLKNIQTEKDDFLRAMMWGSLWDSVREAELAPEEYVELVIKNINVESDESTIQTLLGRVSTAINYYIENGTRSVPSASAGGSTRQTTVADKSRTSKPAPSADADGTDKNALAVKLEKLLIEKFRTAPTVGQKITYFRALQSIGSGDETRKIFKDLLNGKSKLENVELKTKDKFDLLTRLLILDDKDAPAILADLEKTETSDEAKRYAYAAKAGIKTAENKEKFWTDFVSNKEISESRIEAAFVPFNSIRHSELTLPFLERALAELPNLKKNRKIFFVNGWLAAFIGGQKSEEALKTVNKFLADNPNLDRDLRLKILENADNLERAVKIRAKYGK